MGGSRYFLHFSCTSANKFTEGKFYLPLRRCTLPFPAHSIPHFSRHFTLCILHNFQSSFSTSAFSSASMRFNRTFTFTRIFSSYCQNHPSTVRSTTGHRSHPRNLHFLLNDHPLTSASRISRRPPLQAQRPRQATSPLLRPHHPSTPSPQTSPFVELDRSFADPPHPCRYPSKR